MFYRNSILLNGKIFVFVKSTVIQPVAANFRLLINHLFKPLRGRLCPFEDPMILFIFLRNYLIFPISKFLFSFLLNSHVI